MKFLLFVVLLLNTRPTVNSVLGLTDKILLQPVSSPGLVLRKIPRALPSNIRLPPGRSWPNIVFLKHLFELECLKEIYGRGRSKNRPGSLRPESFVPGPEEPAFKTVNKNPGNDYDKIPDPYRPNTSFENGKRYFGGNVQVIPIPVPYLNNVNGYQRYKAGVSQEGNKFIKDSIPHLYYGGNINEMEKVKQGMISKESLKKPPPHFNTINRIPTSTTTRNPIGGSGNTHIRFYPAEITDEQVIPFNDLITGNSGIPKQDSDNLPMMLSYGDAETFSKFSHQSNRIKQSTASYPENTSPNNLLYESKPRPNHSYEVEEIIEEDIRFDLKEKKEENHMTKKPPGGRQFKFDENAYEGFKMVVPDMMKSANNEVADSTVNTILYSLINPVKRVTGTEGMVFDKSNNAMITPYTNLPPLQREDKAENGYPTYQKDVYISPNPHSNYFNLSRGSTTEKAQYEKKDDFPTHQSVSFSNFQNWKSHSTSTIKYNELPLQQLFPKESQRDMNFKNLATMGQKTDDEDVKPDSNSELSGFRLQTLSPLFYDQLLTLSPTSSKNRPNQLTTIPSKSTQDVLFTPNHSPKPYNNFDFQTLQRLAEEKEQKSAQQLFTSVPLLRFTVEHQNTETEPPEKEETTSTQSEFLEIQTEFDLPNSSDNPKSKAETETDQKLLVPAKSSGEQNSISESVAFENLFTTAIYTGNAITGLSQDRESFSSTSSSSTWMAVSKSDGKLKTEGNYFEEDKDMKTTAFKEFTDVPMTDDLLDTSKKDPTQESNSKNSRKMHFNQEPKKAILDNQITDDRETGKRRSDILINDTLEDDGENDNKISSLNYLESLKENSSHLSPGSLIKISPESIIPIIPQIINDLRDAKFSDENLKVLSHAFGKYWPYVQVLSKNTNLDILPLMKMKDEKDLESILTSLVLEEPSTTTAVKQDTENILAYDAAYDYREDYKEIYLDILNQELGEEYKKKIPIKRDAEDDLKTVEATREYFESIAEEQNEEDSDYIYEDVMYDDIPYDESDSSIFELMGFADLQVYDRNITS